MYHCAKIHLRYNNFVNLHNYCSTNVFLQIYTITIAQIYFCTMIHRLICLYFRIGEIYTITLAMQMNFYKLFRLRVVAFGRGRER